MKYRSPIFSQASGSLGGATFSQNKGGSFVRERKKPTNPSTAAQVAQRAQFAATSANWANLTDAQRAAWNAATADFPYQDNLGQTKQYSGSQLFCSLNGALKAVNPTADYLNEPPASVSIPALTWPDMTLRNDGGVLDIGTTPSPGAVPTDFKATVYATAPMSPGIMSVQASKYKKVTVMNASGAIVNFAGNYAEVLGAPTIGRKIFVKIVLTSTVSGQTGKVFEGSAIVTAL